MTTREKIIYESLKLFSVEGYDSVSTRKIAAAVGISDTGLYKHFKNKQEIFDTIISICKKRFIEQRMKADLDTMDWDEVENLCMDMFYFQTHDEWMVMFRQLVVIEQFKNPSISKLYQEFFVDIAVNSQTVMFQTLMDQGYMKKKDAKVLAIELYAPFFMYHTFYREDEELMNNLRQHVRYFRETYQVK